MPARNTPLTFSSGQRTKKTQVRVPALNEAINGSSGARKAWSFAPSPTLCLQPSRSFSGFWPNKQKETGGHSPLARERQRLCRARSLHCPEESAQETIWHPESTFSSVPPVPSTHIRYLENT